jgi:hypothetical protein
MTAKLISLAGLLLMLSSPAFAAPAPDPAVQAASASEPAQTAVSDRATQQPQRLAWQRVGSPLSLET